MYVLLGRSHAYTRRIRRGIHRAIQARALPWSVEDWDEGLMPKRGVGLIALVRGGLRQRLRQARIPVINVSGSGFATPQRMRAVYTDHQAIGRLAADHLAAVGYRQGLFIGRRLGVIEGARYRAFAQRAIALGMECVGFHPWEGLDTDLPTRPQAVAKLVACLQQIPKPVGIYSFTDFYLDLVRDACRLAGLQMPSQVGLLGTDDDDLLCECGWPTLSSIDVGAEAIGSLAVTTLVDLHAGRTVALQQTVRPVGVTVRRSTDGLVIPDPELRELLQWIRQQASGIRRVADVLERAACSRRTLERRMQRCLGHGLLDEIHRAKVERVKELLRQPDLGLARVAHIAGFGSRQQLHAVFRRYTGEQPGAYRHRVLERENSSHTMRSRA